MRLPLQDGDLVAQREDFGAFVSISHRQQPQERERVGHTAVGQSQQHNDHSCARSASIAWCIRTGRDRGCTGVLISAIKKVVTRTDEVLGTLRVQ
ncbi:hypothetical protein [Micromonospora sonneratiae]|uniref:Uncharacterized protein n=1 Tax=Micromonospora sonneratiae TaxID=1184706 RepID=A0ABW3YGJ5_9ACTN